MKGVYPFKKIEKKWQKIWEEQKLDQTSDNYKQKKFYVLDMFPYPSGLGLHMGHLKGYVATDVTTRFRRMQGYNVLHPMGWDAFGLPAENFALKHKIHPKKAIDKNIRTFKKQLKIFGLSYDWRREINTTDPDYYKWTQWVFLQMFKRGLVYRKFEPVNWCPSCKTGLANEDVEQGRCERCGSPIQKKPLAQWIIKITKYADRLLEDLKLLDWEEAIVEQQKNWIGRSEGAVIKFPILNEKFSKKERLAVEIFTTRLDTIFGCTYLVLAPEHPIIPDLKSQISNFQEVKRYIDKVKNKPDLERLEGRKKTGVEIEGVKALNPFNQEKIPIFVADYVLPYYGTGAIMAVPAHDERDWEFARKFNLKIKFVIKPQTGKLSFKKVFTEDGILANSNGFSGLTSVKAREKMLKFAVKKGFGRKGVFYKMRDWVFSRQRYWGEPIPLVFCPACKQEIENNPQKARKKFNKGELLNPGWIALPEKELPLELPKVRYYEPTGTGESPLANIKNWMETKCPKCGRPARRESNTMPQWAGSCWYYLRYLDPHNKRELVSPKKERYWMPVDLYVGGAEHATRHLIYARFWHKFLYDINVVSTKEPFKKLIHVGIILGEDGRKMSKRWGNVVNPEDVAREFGADSCRIYELFMGPFTQGAAWSTKGLRGCFRFLNRVWRLKDKITRKKTDDQDLTRLLHQTIKKVTEDIENFKFNTAVAQMMILVNEMERKREISQKDFGLFLRLLAPFAPHLSEELWSRLGHKTSIFKEKWPKFNPKLAESEEVTIVIQVNGRVRGEFRERKGLSQTKVLEMALKDKRINKWVEDRKNIKKVIYIPDKLMNIVVQY